MKRTKIELEPKPFKILEIEIDDYSWNLRTNQHWNAPSLAF
jgi:hypothetical protein